MSEVNSILAYHLLNKGEIKSDEETIFQCALHLDRKKALIAEQILIDSEINNRSKKVITKISTK